MTGLATAPMNDKKPSKENEDKKRPAEEMIQQQDEPPEAAKKEGTPTEGKQEAADQTNKDNSNVNEEESGKKRRAKRRKKKKNEDKQYQSRQRDRDDPPNEGSYANPALRDKFQIDLDASKRLQLESLPAYHSETNRTVKRKVCLLLGYIGTNYGGYQQNADVRSIQSELELALYRSGSISSDNFGIPQKQGYSMSARTDKGVHACAQVVSQKIELLQSEEVNNEYSTTVRQRIQDRLPSDIQLLDIVRASRAFCAKTQRDRVRYQYMIPAFLLHENYQEVFLSHDIPLRGRLHSARAPLSPEELTKVRQTLHAYRSTEHSRSLLQQALKRYEGTRFYQNFTKRLQPGQPQAMRFMESFVCQDPVMIHGVEWIPTQVVGQSFLLHQIRKMISVAVDVTRGVATVPDLERMLTKYDTTPTGLAPAEGLFLEMSYFVAYNQRKNAKAQSNTPDIDWTVEGTPAHDRWKTCRSVIREHITKEEAETGNFIQYMYQQECLFDHKKIYPGQAAAEATGTAAVAASNGSTEEATAGKES